MVAAGVGGGDEIALQAAKSLLHEVVTGHSTGFFDAYSEVFGHARNIGFTRYKRYAEILAEGFAEIEFFVGFRSLAVVQVSGDHVDPDPLKQVQQACAVSATAVPHHHFDPGGDELRLLQVVQKTVKHAFQRTFPISLRRRMKNESGDLLDPARPTTLGPSCAGPGMRAT